jgi:cell wall-associated NlpC family hydrolase
MNNSPSLSLQLKLIALLVIVAQLSGCATHEKAALSALPTDITMANRQAANDAMQLQGQPYVWGGESPIEGFDCSGLVYYVYNKQGVRLPRDTWSLANQLPSVQINQRQPGDLVFFNTSSKPFSHVGIYVGEDRFVHAPSTRTGRVMMSDLKQPYWRERLIAVRRPQSQRPLSFNDSGGNACLLN